MKCKRETDGQRLDDAGKEAIRLRAVKMVVNGRSPEQVAKDLDVRSRMAYARKIIAFQPAKKNI